MFVPGRGAASELPALTSSLKPATQRSMRLNWKLGGWARGLLVAVLVVIGMYYSPSATSNAWPIRRRVTWLSCPMIGIKGRSCLDWPSAGKEPVVKAVDYVAPKTISEACAAL